MSPLGDNEVEKAVEPIEEPTINDEGKFMDRLLYTYYFYP